MKFQEATFPETWSIATKTASNDNEVGKQSGQGFLLSKSASKLQVYPLP